MSIVKLKHEYAVDTLNVIKKGVGINKTFDLAKVVDSFLEQSKNKSFITIPIAIGAYRRATIFEGNVDDLDKISYDNGLRIDSSDESFDVHPSLVKIGYNPQILSKDVLTKFIGPESVRMVMCPYTDLGKDSDIFKQYEILTQQRINSLDKEPAGDQMLMLGDLLSRMKDTDGLTSNEWKSLQQLVSQFYVQF